MGTREVLQAKGTVCRKAKSQKAEGMIEEQLIELWGVITKRGFVL